MSRIPKCLSCQQDMKLVPGTTVRRRSLSGSMYTSRRYKCDLCDVSEVINGTGQYDIDTYPTEIKREKVTFIEDKEACKQVILSAFGIPEHLFNK